MVQKKKLRIVHITSECVPYAKTGGLADVVGALPRALAELGHEVIVIMPLYGHIDIIQHHIQPSLTPIGVWMGSELEWCAAYVAENDGVKVFFIQSNKYFQRAGLYHDQAFNDFLDNPRRFGFLSRAALQLCIDIEFKPDIVHTHDWQTAIACAYQKIWFWDNPILGSAVSVLTIHNIAYQGVYPSEHYDYLGLQWGNFTSDKFEDHGKINFLKGGIQYADIVNTVSPNYARETRIPEYGYGLAMYLSDLGDRYSGILNGVDYTEWNPSIDPLIPAQYSIDEPLGKLICKRELQRRFWLDVDPNIPIVGIVSRFAVQKGLHLLAEVIEPMINNMMVQFVILGAGDNTLEHYYGTLPERFRGRVGSYIGYSNEIAHWIEAGSDFFMMPSIYEPCGLNQIYSLKYGTLPIVHATGGLDDTIEIYDEMTGNGTGFKFYSSNANAIYYTTGWAISTFYDRPDHIQKMINKAMLQDYSWKKSAQEYENLYYRAIGER